MFSKFFKSGDLWIVSIANTKGHLVFKPLDRRPRRRRHAATGALRLEVLPGVLRRADHGGPSHLSERGQGDSPLRAMRGGQGRRGLEV